VRWQTTTKGNDHDGKGKMGKVVIIYASSFMGDNHKLHLFSFPSKLSYHNHFSLNKKEETARLYALVTKETETPKPKQCLASHNQSK